MAKMFIVVVIYLILGWNISSSADDRWPNGNFGLPNTISGCPGGLESGWREGWRFQHMENDKNRKLSSSASFKNHFRIAFHITKMDMIQYFCMLDQIGNNSKSWPRGTYCVYKSSNACPNGMSSNGTVKWDNENTNNVNVRKGRLPDGIYDKDTTINYCCQTNGNWYDSIELPVIKPFYLLTSNSLSSPKCQMVKWATSQMEYILFDTEDDNNSDNLSGNHVFVDTSDSSGRKKFYYCYYKDCRVSVTGLSGSISLHQTARNNMHPHSQYCSWLITVAETFVISLKFSILNVPQCKDTFLNIYDGPNDTSSILGKYCGANASAGIKIRSSTNHLFILSNSGSYGSYPKSVFAFRAQYKAQVLGYRRLYTALSGSISSHDRTPNDTKLHSQYCSWLITAPETFVILLKFSILNIPQCNDKFLTIYDGLIDTSRLLGKYCGENATAQVKILSSTNQLFIVGNCGSNESYSRSVFRFQAQYNAKCLTQENDQWPSGDFGLLKAKTGCPGDWKSGWREGWRFQDMEDEKEPSTASFENHMDVTILDRASGENVNRTFCMLNRTNKETSPWPKGTYCIYKSRGTICPNGMSHGFVRWDDENNGNINKHGGYLPDGTYDIDTIITYCCRTNGNWYDSIELPVIKPFYLLTSNSLSSPKCQMVKWATSQMEYISFNTENTRNLDYYAGDCVFFDTSGSSGLVNLYYCYYKDCRVSISGLSGSISSHQTAKADMEPHSQYCSWLITVPETFVILLTFSMLNIPQCNDTFLYIYNGLNGKSPLLGEYCGENATAGMEIRSSTNHLLIVGNSGSYGSHLKSVFAFRAHYSAHHFAEDQWPTGNFGLPKAKTGCPGDWKSGWREGWRFQDMENGNPRSVASFGNHMDVTFPITNSNYDIVRKFCIFKQTNKEAKRWPKGSYCLYKSGNTCPQGLNSGYVKFDDEDTDNKNSLGGESRPNDKSRRTCLKGMSSGSVKWDDEDDWRKHDNDYRKQLPYGTYDDNTVIHYCCQTNGNWYDSIELPVIKPFYLLTSNSLSSPKCQIVKWATSQMEYILFNTEDDENIDEFVEAHVFKTSDISGRIKLYYCYYKDCRGSVSGPNGSISSHDPAQNVSDPHSQHCSWLITVPETFVISLKFLILNIPQCNDTFLYIYNGPNDTSPLLGKYCGKNATAGMEILSSTNHLFIVGDSGSYGSHPKSVFSFRAHYKAIEKEQHEEVELETKVEDDDRDHIYEALSDVVDNSPLTISKDGRYEIPHKENVPLPKLPTQNEDDEDESKLPTEKLEYVAVIDSHYQPLIRQQKLVPGTENYNEQMLPNNSSKIKDEGIDLLEKSTTTI
ncbi:cubilin-like isoform X2 [Xenia sp. Carnegie-2017]|uniref:cubilin-like isoform X2 n=1 Tax=Xenia sp. Carnegie-2017 TaxID=2897299 RepID=UPI001F0404F7|nr:cubilin-like isoform X2 [Xenia sp. Carnegie-2017]